MHIFSLYFYIFDYKTPKRDSMEDIRMDKLEKINKFFNDDKVTLDDSKDILVSLSADRIREYLNNGTILEYSDVLDILHAIGILRSSVEKIRKEDSSLLYLAIERGNFEFAEYIVDEYNLNFSVKVDFSIRMNKRSLAISMARTHYENLKDKKDIEEVEEIERRFKRVVSRL